MKLNKYFMLGLAGLAFAACSNDDAFDMGKESNKAVIKISFGRAESRALGETLVDRYNKISDLTINFYTAQGIIVPIPDTYTDPETNESYSNANAIQAAENALKDGEIETELTIKGVPNSATQVYIVANQPTTSPGGNAAALDVSSITKVKASHILLSSQQDCLNSTLTSWNTGKIENGAVTATLTPVPARFELKDLTAKKAPADWTGAEIQSFKVRGIYMNRFAPWGTLSGDLPAGITEIPVIANTDKTENYSVEHYGETTYNYNGTGDKQYDFSFMCDGNDISNSFNYITADLLADQIMSAQTVVGTATETNPTGAQWWGYPILPGAIPHLVIELGVIYNDGSNKEVTRYLVVKKYKDNSGTSVPTATRGYVYQISNLIFDASNLTQVPYEGVQTITATINVAKWKVAPIQPDFN